MCKAHFSFKITTEENEENRENEENEENRENTNCFKKIFKNVLIIVL